VDTCPVLGDTVDMKLSAYATPHGISSQTAWRRWRGGERPAHQWPSGPALVDVPLTPPAGCPHTVAVSARVWSAENRKNPDSQAEPVAAPKAATGWGVANVVKVVNECGGIRPIPVAPEDRCSRLGMA